MKRRSCYRLPRPGRIPAIRENRITETLAQGTLDHPMIGIHGDGLQFARTPAQLLR